MLEINNSDINKSAHRSFTLMEVLLVIALIGIMAGFSIPIYNAFYLRNNLETAANTIVQNLRRAQILSRAVDGDMSWGVYLENGRAVIFKGANYALRDPSFDEISDLPRSVSLSGLVEINFSKFLGETINSGAITLTSSSHETKNISINQKGTIEY